MMAPTSVNSSEQGMQHEADAEVERHPRHVEQRHRSRTGDKAAYGVELAEGMQRFMIALRHP